MEAHERRALPEGWEWKKVGEISEFIRGVSYRAEESSKEPSVTSIM